MTWKLVWVFYITLCPKAVTLLVVGNCAWVSSMLDISAATVNASNCAMPSSDIFSKACFQLDVLFHSSSEDCGISLIAAKE